MGKAPEKLRRYEIGVKGDRRIYTMTRGHRGGRLMMRYIMTVVEDCLTHVGNSHPLGLLPWELLPAKVTVARGLAVDGLLKA